MTFRRGLLLASTPLLCFNAGEALAACKEQPLGGMAAWARVGKTFEKWLKTPPQDKPSDWTWKRQVDLGDGEKTPVTYTVTHMGNGTIELKNLMLRTYRAHGGEDFIYNPYALRVHLAAGPTGCRLSVSGNIDLLDQNGEKKTGHQQADLAYDYDSQSDKFLVVAGHKQAFDMIDLSSAEK